MKNDAVLAFCKNMFLNVTLRTPALNSTSVCVMRHFMPSKTFAPSECVGGVWETNTLPSGFIYALYIFPPETTVSDFCICIPRFHSVQVPEIMRQKYP